MNTLDAILNLLKSDDVLAEALLASDVDSFSHRLSRMDPVCRLAKEVEAEPRKVWLLYALVQKLLNAPHDPRYRHPNDVAISAALMVLGTIPLAPIRSFVRNLSEHAPSSLSWARLVAERCEQLFGERTLSLKSPDARSLMGSLRFRTVGQLLPYTRSGKGRRIVASPRGGVQPIDAVIETAEATILIRAVPKRISDLIKVPALYLPVGSRIGSFLRYVVSGQAIGVA